MDFERVLRIVQGGILTQPISTHVDRLLCCRLLRFIGDMYTVTALHKGYMEMPDFLPVVKV
jgi:hypothetical protein